MHITDQNNGSVAEADPFNDLLKRSIVVGILPVFYPITDEVAQNAAEVVMAGVAQEAAGIGQHTDEIAQQS